MRRVGSDCPIYGGTQRFELERLGEQPKPESPSSFADVVFRKGGDEDYGRKVSVFAKPVHHVEPPSYRACSRQ